MAYIVEPEELSEIRDELGPQPEEGQVFLVKAGVKVRQGAGMTKAAETSTLLPARVSYQPYRGTQEKVQAGSVGARLRYLVELPAFTDVNEDDFIDIAAPTWSAGAPVDAGQERIPSTPDGYIYAATSKGVTGDTEPTWGATVTYGFGSGDGTTAWTRKHPYLRISIAEVAEADPYEITRNVWGDLKT